MNAATHNDAPPAKVCLQSESAAHTLCGTLKSFVADGRFARLHTARGDVDPTRVVLSENVYRRSVPHIPYNLSSKTGREKAISICKDMAGLPHKRFAQRIRDACKKVLSGF